MGIELRPLHMLGQWFASELQLNPKITLDQCWYRAEAKVLLLVGARLLLWEKGCPDMSEERQDLMSWMNTGV